MNQFQKDMQWCLQAPSLMNPPESRDGADWIRKLYRPGSLADTGQTQPAGQYRLGLYYETIIRSILKNTPQLSDLYHNIQVIDAKRTVGEFDFIGRLSGGLTFHLECAIKFYLRVGDGSCLDHFVGPARQDRLGLKWQRLIDKQLNLSQTDAGQTRLNELGFDGIDRTLVLIQGYLFHPYDEFPVTAAASLHQAINKDHLQGWWLRQYLAVELTRSISSFQLLLKPRWLTPETCGSAPAFQSELLTAESFLERIGSTTQPVLVARIDSSGKEVDRGFVVPDDW
ncbi:DUF1853 family protein [Marinobacterium jannaschii]|uniref:DUF1853 family protein n=1 Tax=Marinobacterium jannaschii TaxID=64970 RepID=UPI00047FF8B9|nr:DUF1853 family protein [Marinobacterium jannaschii]